MIASWVLMMLACHLAVGGNCTVVTQAFSTERACVAARTLVIGDTYFRVERAWCVDTNTGEIAK